MTLIQLRHLISVAETGSFTRSSELLHLTQPALSRSIRALEEEVGQRLFDRVGKRSELTPFGIEALQRAKMLVFEAEELVARGQGRLAGHSGKLRLGLGATPAAVLTPSIIRTMAARHPTVHLEIARGQPEQLIRSLRERRLDALVMDPRSLPAAADLSVTGSVDLRGAVMCRPDHPLTRWKGPLPFVALRQFVIAATPWSDEVGRDILEQYGPVAHLDECVTLRCDDLRDLVDIARDTDIVMLALRAGAPDLVELSLSPPLCTHARFGVITLTGRSEPPAMPLIRNLVKQLLRD